MKIACLIHSLNGGGAERVMAGLASRLADRGHQVTLITLDDGRHDKHQVAPAVERLSLGVMSESRGKLSAVWNVARRVGVIRSTLRDVAPEALLSFCDRTNILAGMACRGAGCLDDGRSGGRLPTVLSERSDPAKQVLPLMWRLLRRYSYRAASVLVVQTERAAEYFNRPACLPSVYPPSVVIASAVEPADDRRDVSVASANKRFVAVGRLSLEKGFDRLVDAFAAIAGDYPEWSLRILGDGDQRDALSDQIGSLGIESRVSMPGWSTEVGRELAEATVFVLPSRYEGFPSALLEAMAAGVASIALTDQAGSQAVMTHQVDGLLVEPGDLSQAMRRMIDHPDDRERWGRAGQSVSSRFGWPAMVDAYERLLESVVKDTV